MLAISLTAMIANGQIGQEFVKVSSKVFRPNTKLTKDLLLASPHNNNIACAGLCLARAKTEK